MYKYYKKNRYDVMYQYFDSIVEFLDYIDNTETSKEFKNLELSSMKNNSDWSGTKNLIEAEELVKYGYSKNFNKFLDLKLKLEK